MRTAKQIWPSIIDTIYGVFQNPFLWLTLNMVVISAIIWPDEPIHTQEIAFIYGLCYILGAFSKLCFGILADKYSRIKLITITCIGSSLGFLLYGFMPVGLGETTFYYLIGITFFREAFTADETILASYLDDTIEENDRSRVLGQLATLGQVMYIIATLLCSFFFEYIWKYYFISFGLIGIFAGLLIFIKGEEPKRGAKRNELKNLLKLEEMEYKYNLTKNTIKSTIFSRSNIIILIEGIFTQIILIVPSILLLGYLESPPYNFSPSIFGLLGLLFGIPGTIVGNISFAKKIDKMAQKNIKNRVITIIITLIFSYFIWVLVFFIPYQPLSVPEGKNFIVFISFPIHLICGILYFLGNMMGGIFGITQRPLIQRLNLPEAQGAITSINTFFEILSIGIGAIIAGSLLTLFNNDYTKTVLILMIIGILGAFIWGFALKTLDKDLERISSILTHRANEIREKNSDNVDSKRND